MGGSDPRPHLRQRLRGKAVDRLPAASSTVNDVAIDIAAEFLPPGLSHAVLAVQSAAELRRGRDQRREEWLAVLVALRLSAREGVGRRTVRGLRSRCVSVASSAPL